MLSIPSPVEARDLRVLFADHPIVALALKWLEAAGVDHVRDVAEELPRWEFYGQLSAREVAATLATFVPLPADRCARCGAEITYVTLPPDPGWWRHRDIEAMLSAELPAHPALPDYGTAQPATGAR